MPVIPWQKRLELVPLTNLIVDAHGAGDEALGAVGAEAKDACAFDGWESVIMLFIVLLPCLPSARGGLASSSQ